ncbi:MAG: NAD(P)H-dependent oxidoreductase [Oscillospiraceae bacterium]|nr:NAD(P)H-dependent oxidoreductase [Oscillospiraceae bacterium]
MKALVVYFSTGGKTAAIAKEVAEKLPADLFEICPQDPYSSADIKWTNPVARCNREKLGNKDVPVVGKIENFEEYDTIILGFPLWYGGAPNVVTTFCKGYDWTGKNVCAFATSLASGIGKTAEKLTPFVKGATILGAKRVTSAEEVLKDF